MPISTVAKTVRDGTLSFADNGGANSFTLAYEVGDLKVTIPEKQVIDIEDRGTIVGHRYGKDQKTTGSLTVLLRDMADASYPTELDLLVRTGAVANWVSRDGANAEVMSYLMTLTIEGTNHGDASDHTLEQDYTVIESIAMSEGFPSTLSLSWSSRQKPTLT